MWAAFRGRVGVCKILIQNGADTSFRATSNWNDMLGKTAAEIALAANHEETAVLLKPPPPAPPAPMPNFVQSITTATAAATTTDNVDNKSDHTASAVRAWICELTLLVSHIHFPFWSNTD